MCTCVYVCVCDSIHDTNHLPVQCLSARAAGHQRKAARVIRPHHWNAIKWKLPNQVCSSETVRRSEKMSQRDPRQVGRPRGILFLPIRGLNWVSYRLIWLVISASWCVNITGNDIIGKALSRISPAMPLVDPFYCAGLGKPSFDGTNLWKETP